MVAVVATGFAPRSGPLRDGVARLKRMGYRVRCGANLSRIHGYLAGTDDQRVSDLTDALGDPEVKAVWFARGGYGTARLLDSIGSRMLSSSRKLFIGYSDLTALFCSALRSGNKVCLYGPVVTELADEGAYHLPSLRSLIMGREVTIKFRKSQVVSEGKAAGRLLGGNLSVLVHLLGTRHLPAWNDAVLVLEDVGEEVYRLDRLLTHLRMAGVLERVAGVCLGSFDPPKAGRRFPPDRPLSDLLTETFRPLGIPVVAGLPFGHVRRKRTLPLGGAVELDTESRTIRISPRPPC